MRLDIPHDLDHDVPRRRRPETPRPATPLGPGPLEGERRERLATQAEVRRMPEIPRNRREDGVPRERTREGQAHKVGHDLPMERRTRRHELPQQSVGLSLRQEEIHALTEIGKFRVLATRDLAETVYRGHPSPMQRDLRFLEQQKLVEVDSVNARRDGRGGRVERIEVVTLTGAGRDMVRQITGLPDDQKLYAGLVKPREVEHDTQIYRAYLKEAERIERNGGSNLRVQLDFELKSQIQKAIYAARKVAPGRDLSEIKRQVAQQFDLPFVNDTIQIPDARIQYDLDREVDQDTDQGSRTGHEDIEVLTAAYRPGHLRSKAQAGFHVYASSADRATLSARVEDDHHLMEHILEL